MAKTLTDQAHLFPASGTTGFEDGDGFSTRATRDLPSMLNNMWETAGRMPGFSAGASSVNPGSVWKPLFYFTHASAPANTYLCQKPIRVPFGARRLWFAAGVGIWVSNGAFTRDTGATSLYASVTEINVYLSSNPYRNNAGDTFSEAKLLPGFKKVTVAVAGLDFVTAGSKYVFVKDGSLLSPTPDQRSHIPSDFVHLIVTLTGKEVFNDPETTEYGQIHDFTQWFSFE